MSILVQLGAILNKCCLNSIACVLLYLSIQSVRGGVGRRTGDLVNPVVTDAPLEYFVLPVCIVVVGIIS